MTTAARASTAAALMAATMSDAESGHDEDLSLLDEVVGDDLAPFLSNDEHRLLAELLGPVEVWLKAYRTAGAEPTSYDYELEVPLDVREAIKRLIHLAQDRKAAWPERAAALKEIEPIIRSAAKYLDEAERGSFIQSVPGAIDAYVARNRGMETLHPGMWMASADAIPYYRWLKTIEQRRQAAIERKRAEKERSEHVQAVTAAAKELKLKLGGAKKPTMTVHPALEGHTPELWCQSRSPTEAEMSAWVDEEVHEVVPMVLAEIIGWEGKCQKRIVPRARYELTEDMPSLVWTFSTHILVAVKLRLTGGVMMKKNAAGCSVEQSADGAVLGTMYLGPCEWPTPGSFATPVSLLAMFAEGALAAPGIAVMEHGGGHTVFLVAGIEDQPIVVHDDFRQFIKEIAAEHPLGEALLDAGLIDADTAILVEAGGGQPLESANAPVGGVTAVDDVPVKEAIEGLGYPLQAIDAAMATAVLSPGMSLEQKVGAVLKVLEV
jgi:hypothetical protein